jgi:hypothetical protein
MLARLFALLLALALDLLSTCNRTETHHHGSVSVSIVSSDLSPDMPTFTFDIRNDLDTPIEVRPFRDLSRVLGNVRAITGNKSLQLCFQDDFVDVRPPPLHSDTVAVPPHGCKRVSVTLTGWIAARVHTPDEIRTGFVGMKLSGILLYRRGPGGEMAEAPIEWGGFVKVEKRSRE